MSQGIFSTINPATTSGNQLATILNDFKDAVVSGFTGTSRPTNLQAGGYWVDTATAGYYIFKMYDGTSDLTVFNLNLTTGVASITSADSLFTVTKTSADSVGPISRLTKKRVANNGQTLNGDTIGELQFYVTRDDGVSVLSARIRSITTDDATTSVSGSYIVLEATSDATNSVTEILRAVDGKVGIGTTAPSDTLHVAGTGAKVEKISADAVGSKVNIKKKRIATNGQTLSSDVIGEVNYLATDDLGADVGAVQLEVTTRENTTTTAHGSQLKIKNKKIGQTSYTDQVTIAESVTVNTDLTVTGNMTVNGTTTSVNSTTLDVVDSNVTVNKGGTQAAANANSAGIKVEMSDATHAQLKYDSTATSKFKIGNVGSEVEVATISNTQTLTNKTLTGNTAANLKPDGSATLTLPVATDTVVARATTDTLTNKTIDDELRMQQISTPSNPSAGYNKLYFKNDDKLYKKTAGGTEAEIGSGAGSGLISINPSSVKTANYTVVSGDNGGVILVDSSGGSFTVTLPDPSSSFRVTIKDVTGACSLNPVTVARFASESIDGGAANDIINQSYQATSYVTNLTNWFRVTTFSGNATAGRGLFGGGGSGAAAGYSALIDYVAIPTNSNASTFGNLTVARTQNGAFASGTRAVWGGGFTGSVSSTYDYVTIATTGNAASFGTLTAGRRLVAGLSSSTRGVLGGGKDSGGSLVDTIEYVTIATTGNGTSFGILANAYAGKSGCSSPTRGVFWGGEDNSPATFTVIDYITIATTGNSTSFGTMGTARSRMASCSNQTRGICAGGDTNAGGTDTSVISYISIASTSSDSSFGSLAQARHALAANSNATRGVFGGGSNSGAAVSTISYIILATTANDQSFGTLTARTFFSGTSDSHGGL